MPYYNKAYKKMIKAYYAILILYLVIKFLFVQFFLQVLEMIYRAVQCSELSSHIKRVRDQVSVRVLLTNTRTK